MSVFGNRMSKQMVTQLQWTLAFVGTLILMTGVSLVTIHVPQPVASLPASHLLSDGVTYIGAETCFTCHHEFSDDEPLQPIAIEGAKEAATPVLTVVQDEGRSVEMGGATTPYMAGTANQHDPQRYLMQTGEGITILPGVWNRAMGTWVQQNPDGWPTECVGCHSKTLDVGVRQAIPTGQTEMQLPRLIAAQIRPSWPFVTTLGL